MSLHRRHPGRLPHRPKRSGFTLTEILVVIGVIGLALSIVLPSMVKLFSTGAEAQAANIISATLGAARGSAIAERSYALVHMQIGTDGECWLAVLRYQNEPSKPQYATFVPTDGFEPRMLPGHLAAGEVSSAWVQNEHFKPIRDDQMVNFTTLNIVFGPDGSLVDRVPNAAGNPDVPVLDTTSALFADKPASKKLWDPNVPNLILNEPGVRAITLFSYKTLKVLDGGAYTSQGSRAHYLTQNGLFRCINPYTGQLIPAE